MFLCLIHFPGSLAGAADDCSWQPEGAPEHVLFWGKVVGLEIVPEIIIQCRSGLTTTHSVLGCNMAQH
jgi:hypothetical protein